MSEMDWNAVRETLMFNPKNGYQRISDQDRTEMETYCNAYMDFVGAAKTEREAVRLTVEAARRAGFVEFNPEMQLRPGDRIYRVNRQKAVFFAVVGRKGLERGTRIAVAHID